MKLRKISAILLAISTALTPMALASCADIHAAADSLLKKVGATDTVSTGSRRQPNSEQYNEAAEAWVTVLSNYAHEPYYAGDSVKNINILYLGYMFCYDNAYKLDSLILTNFGGAPSSLSVSGAELTKICQKLIASDFSLSDYHSSMIDNSDELYSDAYYAGEDMYTFGSGCNNWEGDKYRVSYSTATALSNGNVSVEACVFHSPGTVGEADDFRLLEYELEPIVEGEVVYFRLLRITDKGGVDDLTKTESIQFSFYRNLSDGTYSDSDPDIPWEDRPVIAEATLELPLTYFVSCDEVISYNPSNVYHYSRFITPILIKVSKDYVLDHGIHSELAPKVDRYSPDYGIVWNYLDGYKEFSGRSASGYDYIGYYIEYDDADGVFHRNEQRYYRISDEYVLSVIFGGEKDLFDIGNSALDNMTVEVK